MSVADLAHKLQPYLTGGGAPGPQGPPGADGTDGTDGADGAPGADGADGATIDFRTAASLLSDILVELRVMTAVASKTLNFTDDVDSVRREVTEDSSIVAELQLLNAILHSTLNSKDDLGQLRREFSNYV